MIITYGNQRTIEINIREEHIKEDNIKARATLNGAAYKLYSFFCDIGNTTIAFSPTYLQRTENMNRGTAHKAFAELQEKGYIAHVSDNHYIFYSAGAPI